MPSFTIINSIREIDLPDAWVDPKKFNSQYKEVDSKGNYIESTYRGRKYTLISKKVRERHILVYAARGFVGILAVVCSLGLLYLGSKSVRHLFNRNETIRYGIPTEIENGISKTELEKGIFIPDDALSKIQSSIQNITQLKEVEGINYFNSSETSRVFALDLAPVLIFKMKSAKRVDSAGRDDSMKARFQGMIKAQTVLRNHQLDLLVLPHAKLFNVKVGGEVYEIIAEQRLDITSNESVQEHAFAEHARHLDETVRQLATFICKTGYSDVDWRNIPILNNRTDEEGNRKIALIDIEEMTDPVTGLFGHSATKRRGLVGCIDESQGKIVEKIAKDNGIKTELFRSAYAQRKEELREINELSAFYERNRIIAGDEVIRVDMTKLGLDLAQKATIQEMMRDERGRPVVKDDDLVYQDREITLGEVAEKVMEEINRCIQENPKDSSKKRKRYLLLNTHREPFKSFDELGTSSTKVLSGDKEEFWLRQIIDALVKKGHLFKLAAADDHGYYIQA